MAGVTRQYLAYVDEIRSRNLELAAEYLLMAAMLIEIKSRMLLPPASKGTEGQEAEDPRAELVRRLLEYEQMKLAAQPGLNELPQLGRDFLQGPGLYRAVAATALSRCARGRSAGGLARHPQTRQAGAAPQDHARRAVGARTHEHVLKTLQGRALWSLKNCSTPAKARPCWW
jgi:hypothetical protein